MRKNLLHYFVSQVIWIIFLHIHSLPAVGECQGATIRNIAFTLTEHEERKGGGAHPFIMAMAHAVLEGSRLLLALFTHEQDRDGPLFNRPDTLRARSARNRVSGLGCTG